MSSPWKMKANSGGGAQGELPEPGNHPAVLVALIDLGTHRDDYGGKVSWNRKIYLAWELSAEDSRPVVGRDFTLSFNSKALLRQWVQRWRGKDFADGEEFDIAKLLSKPCLLQVSHRAAGDRKYPKADSVGSVPKGTTVPAPKHTPVIWSLDDGDASKLPEWLPFLYGQNLAQWVADSAERSQTAASERERDRRQAGKGDAYEPAEARSSGQLAGVSGVQGSEDDIPF